MPDWITVEIEDAETLRKKSVRGIDVQFFVSPYDIPEAIRGRYDAQHKKFVIEFKYVGNESTTKVEDKHVTYNVGQTSRRLYGLAIDVEALRAEIVGLNVEVNQIRERQELADRILNEITEAIESLIERHPGAGTNERDDNYKLAKDAVIAKQAELSMAASA